MQTNRTPHATKSELLRGATRSASAIAAALLLTSAVFGQGATPRPAAAPRAATAPRPATAQSPTPKAAPPAPAREDYEDGDDFDYDFDAPEMPEIPEMPEMPEIPEMPETPEAYAPDVNIDLSGMQMRLESLRAMPVIVGPMAPMAFSWGNGGSSGGWQSRQHFDEVAKETDPARRAYLEGRNFVADSEWEKAAGRFNEVITKYQTSKVVDASLFWYAYSLKSESHYGDSYDALQRLITTYPQSRWTGDAKKLLVEVAAPAGRPVPPEIKAEYDEQIKMVALQSLLQTKPEQVIPIVREYFKPGSTASEHFKLQVTVMLSQADSPEAIDLLLSVARTDTSPKVRRQALLMLGQRLDDKQRGEQIFALLRDIAQSNDAENAKYAVVALGQDDSQRAGTLVAQLATSAQLVEVRKQALVMLAQRNDPGSCDAMVKIYDTEKDGDLKRTALVMLAQSDCPGATDKLVQVARSGDSIEARRFALTMLGQKDRPKAVQTLIQMYDSEKNETIKGGIIDGLGQAVDETSDKAALHKLMDIAKKEPSLELRRKAIFWIGQSKDPEATQFLVDLLK